jgi:hypothetical protein
MQKAQSVFSVVLLAGSLATAQQIQPATQMDSHSWTGLLVAAGCQSSSASMTARSTSRENSMKMDRSMSARSTSQPEGMPTSTARDMNQRTLMEQRTAQMDRETGSSIGKATPKDHPVSDHANQTYEQQQNQADRSNMPLTTAQEMSQRTSTRDYTGDANRNSMPPSANQSERQVREKVPGATDTVSTPPVDAENTRGSAPLNDRMEDDRMIAANMDANCRIGQDTTAFALRTEDGRLIMLDDASNAKIAQQLASTNRVKNTLKILRVQVNGSMQDNVIHVDSIRM